MPRDFLPRGNRAQGSEWVIEQDCQINLWKRIGGGKMGRAGLISGLPLEAFTVLLTANPTSRAR
jgi:hypothetical protein